MAEADRGAKFMIQHNHIKNFQDFLGSNPDIKAGFEKACITRKVSKGNIIVGQDESDHDMFLLREGDAKVVIYSKGGHEVQLAEFSAGTLFGEMAALLGTSRSSNVVATINCKLDSISAKDFETLMQSYPKLAVYMTQMLAKRLQQTSQNLFEAHAFTVPQRLYEILIRRANQKSGSSEIYKLAPAPTVTSLSECLNVSREATSRAVTKLSKRGLVTKEKSHWEILRPDFGDA
jgi:CRP-like cAMP-binding protein